MPHAKAPSKVVDCHAHAVPESLLQQMAGGQQSRAFAARRTEQGWLVTTPDGDDRLIRAGMFDSHRRAAMASSRGLDVQVLSPWMDLQPTATMPAAAARRWAQRINESLVAEVEPSAFGPTKPAFATVALDDADVAAEDLACAVRDLGMAGLVLSTDPAHCVDLADARLEPLWTAAEELAAPVMLHPSTDGPSRALPGSAEFGNAYCRLVDTTFGVAKLLLSGVLDRHPGLRLVTVHGGGFLPFQAMRLDGAHRADALAGYRLERGAPSAYLNDLYYDTVAMSPAAIRFLADAIGADQVLLGTDHPFPLGDQQPVETVRAAALGAHETTGVLGGNMTRLITGGQRA